MSISTWLSGVRRDVLPNGLTLLTREQRGSGVAAILTWVKAGYFHEPDEVAGMAHLFEHMFFKGSKKFPGAEEIAQTLSTLGGMTNAATIYDSTHYYFVVPREAVVRAMEIQADAVANPLFDPDELKKEAEVVIEESNRKFDNPPAVATERMFATAFTRHRMKRWRIGSNEVLRNIRRDHLVEFFETLYRPENIIVSVVGDVLRDEILEVAGRTFGALPAGESKKERGPAEPQQNEFRFGQSEGDITQSYSVVGWHTPGEGHADGEKLEILATILGGGRYSRLFRNVVGPGKANGVAAFDSVFEDVGIFTIRISADEKNLERAESLMLAEVERLRRMPPTEFELQLAKNRLESSFVFEIEHVLGQAEALAYYESRGGYQSIASHLERLLAVTRDDVRDVASRYLPMSNATLYRYRKAGATRGSLEDVARSYREATSQQLAPAEEIPLPAAAQPVAASESDGAIQRFVLPNGATLFVKERRETPAVSTSLYFRGGRIHESSRNAGITQLMARSMRRGTTTRSAEQIDREIEFLGTQLGISVESDFFSVSIDVEQRHVARAWQIAADVLLNPTFPPEKVEEERHLQLAAIRRSFDSSSQRPFDLFYEAFYRNHPYGLPDSGFVSTIESLDVDDLREWYAHSIVADGAVFFVVGDVRGADVARQFEKIFAPLPKSRSLRPAAPRVVPNEVPLEIVELRQKKQTAIVIGFPTVPPQHPDWPMLRLLQDVVSGLAGTFFAELRGRRSLAYTVYAGESSRMDAGAFVGYIACDASKERDAREGLLSEIRRLAEDGVTQPDLDRAKAYMAGSTRIRRQTNSAIADDLAQNYLFGLGLDFTDRFLERVHAIALEEIRTVAKKYLSRDNYAVAILRGKELDDAVR